MNRRGVGVDYQAEAWMEDLVKELANGIMHLQRTHLIWRVWTWMALERMGTRMMVHQWYQDIDKKIKLCWAKGKLMVEQLYAQPQKHLKWVGVAANMLIKFEPPLRVVVAGKGGVSTP